MHSLVVGITESGKTVILKKLSKRHIAQGFQVAVLTPIFEQWPEGVLLFTDQDEFLDWYWGNTGAIAIIDEGKQTAHRYNAAMEQTAETGRHAGHQNYYAAQGASMISHDIRKNCTQLFCFNQGPKDAESLAQEWSQPRLLEAPELLQGEFLLVRRFGKDRKKFVQKLDAFEGGYE